MIARTISEKIALHQQSYKDLTIKFNSTISYLEKTPVETLAIKHDVKATKDLKFLSNFPVQKVKEELYCVYLCHPTSIFLRHSFIGTLDNLSIKVKVYQEWLKQEELLINRAKKI